MTYKDKASHDSTPPCMYSQRATLILQHHSTHTATHCNTLQHTATHPHADIYAQRATHTPQHLTRKKHAHTLTYLVYTATFTLQHLFRQNHVAVCCSVLCCSVLQCVAVCCSVLQCVAVSSFTLQTEPHSHFNTAYCIWSVTHLNLQSQSSWSLFNGTR